MLRHFVPRLGAAVSVAVLLMAGLSVPASAASHVTRWVDDDGNDCPSATFTSIQPAINASSAGDRVYVCKGTYTEQLTLDRKVTVGAKPLRMATIVAPDSLTAVGGAVSFVRLTGNHAVLRGFRLEIAAGDGSCTAVDAAILILGQHDVVRENAVTATGDATYSGACGYSYGIVAGMHAPAPAAHRLATAAVDTSATARITFNDIKDFKAGGILVEGQDSDALVRRNRLRYFHENDPTNCASTSALSPVGTAGCARAWNNAIAGGQLNTAFPVTFGIGIEDDARADVIRNAVLSGPNACISSCQLGSTSTLQLGITVKNLDASEHTTIFHNAVWRTGAGIRTDTGADGVEISHNHTFNNVDGLQLVGNGDDIHDNLVDGNLHGTTVSGSNNNIHGNDSRGNAFRDCQDNTSGGSGTAGTQNEWTNDLGIPPTLRASASPRHHECHLESGHTPHPAECQRIVSVTIATQPSIDNSSSAGRRVELLIGTRKGAFILESDASRRHWDVRGPFCETWPIHHVVRAKRDGALYAAGGNAWYGPSVWRSDDNGARWTQSSAGLTYGDDGPKITTIWNVTPSNGTLYAGVEPAGLFRSDDRGETWSHVAGLRDHPSRPQWEPGNGGLCLHSIAPHPTDSKRMWVGISAVGTFETADGGKTWETRNQGVRADFVPGPPPEFGQCVHNLRLHPANPEVLFQQNHCGVYRSEDGGRQWTEITSGLPSEFGFPLAIHPHDPSTVYVIPLNGADRGRHMIDGHTSVWRSRDAGGSWQQLDDGLPTRDAYLGVLREAMTMDLLSPAGVYFGTSTGQVFGSADEGDHWTLAADFLPPIWSVEATVVDS